MSLQNIPTDVLAYHLFPRLDTLTRRFLGMTCKLARESSRRARADGCKFARREDILRKWVYLRLSQQISLISALAVTNKDRRKYLFSRTSRLYTGPATQGDSRGGGHEVAWLAGHAIKFEDLAGGLCKFGCYTPVTRGEEPTDPVVIQKITTIAWKHGHTHITGRSHWQTHCVKGLGGGLPVVTLVNYPSVIARGHPLPPEVEVSLGSEGSGCLEASIRQWDKHPEWDWSKILRQVAWARCQLPEILNVAGYPGMSCVPPDIWSRTSQTRGANMRAASMSIPAIPMMRGNWDYLAVLGTYKPLALRELPMHGDPKDILERFLAAVEVSQDIGIHVIFEVMNALPEHLARELRGAEGLWRKQFLFGIPVQAEHIAKYTAVLFKNPRVPSFPAITGYDVLAGKEGLRVGEYEMKLCALVAEAARDYDWLLRIICANYRLRILRSGVFQGILGGKQLSRVRVSLEASEWSRLAFTLCWTGVPEGVVENVIP